MDDLRRLERILNAVGPHNIWRPIHLPGQRRLAAGVGDRDDGLPPDLGGIDFTGKTVADIGCNFGFYGFMVRRAGARHVTGLDIDERIIEGCRLLKRLHGIDGISFVAADINQADDVGTFDTGMMIDFIGKTAVSTGHMNGFLDALERLSRQEMIISLRPAYHLKKHLGADADELRRQYPEAYIHHDHFFTLDYVHDRFRRAWDMAIVSNAAMTPGTKKETLLFRRINGPAV